MRISPVLSVAALLMMPAPAFAQVQVWNCEEGIRDLTGQLPTVLTRYQMTLNGDGTFHGQGVMDSVGIQYPVQMQGQWQSSGSAFRKAGSRQDGLNGNIPYELHLTIAAEGWMHDTTQAGNRVFAAQCQRVQ